MIILSLITLIAIIQAYRSYPQLNPNYKAGDLVRIEGVTYTTAQFLNDDWSLNNPKLGTVYGHSATKRVK